jgi:hypothetical protein
MDGKRVKNKWIESSKKAKINDENVLTYLKNGEGKKHVKIGKKYIPLNEYKKQVKQIGGEQQTRFFYEKEWADMYKKYEKDVEINLVKKDLEKIFIYLQSVLKPEKNYDLQISDVVSLFTSEQKNIDILTNIYDNDIIIVILTNIYNDLKKFVNENNQYDNFHRFPSLHENSLYKMLFWTTNFLGKFLQEYKYYTTDAIEYRYYRTPAKKMNGWNDWKNKMIKEMDDWKYKNVGIYISKADPFHPDIDDTISIFLKILLHLHSCLIKKKFWSYLVYDKELKTKYEKYNIDEEDYEKYNMDEEDKTRKTIDIITVRKDLNYLFNDPKNFYHTFAPKVIESTDLLFTSIQENNLEKFEKANNGCKIILHDLYHGVVRKIIEEEIKESEYETIFKTRNFLQRFSEKLENYENFLTIEDIKKYNRHIGSWKSLNMEKINSLLSGNKVINERLLHFIYFDDTIFIFLKILLHLYSDQVKKEERGAGEEAVEEEEQGVEEGVEEQGPVVKKEERGAGEEAVEEEEQGVEEGQGPGVEKKPGKTKIRLASLKKFPPSMKFINNNTIPTSQSASSEVIRDSSPGTWDNDWGEEAIEGGKQNPKQKNPKQKPQKTPTSLPKQKPQITSQKTPKQKPQKTFTNSTKSTTPKITHEKSEYKRTEEKILMKMDGKSLKLTVYTKGARGIRYYKDGSEYKLCSEIERANKKRERGIAKKKKEGIAKKKKEGIKSTYQKKKGKNQKVK